MSSLRGRLGQVEKRFGPGVKRYVILQEYGPSPGVAMTGSGPGWEQYVVTDPLRLWKDPTHRYVGLPADAVVVLVLGPGYCIEDL